MRGEFYFLPYFALLPYFVLQPYFALLPYFACQTFYSHIVFLFFPSEWLNGLRGLWKLKAGQRSRILTLKLDPPPPFSFSGRLVFSKKKLYFSFESKITKNSLLPAYTPAALTTWMKFHLQKEDNIEELLCKVFWF